jgi:hypothetical protein
MKSQSLNGNHKAMVVSAREEASTIVSLWKGKCFDAMYRNRISISILSTGRKSGGGGFMVFRRTKQTPDYREAPLATKDMYLDSRKCN